MIRIRLTCLLAVFPIAFSLFLACGEAAESSQTASSTNQLPPPTSPQAKIPSLTPPYPIEDSSRFESIQGMKIYTIVQGNGPIPKPRSHVIIHYRGTLMDGTEFDNSFTKGTLADYPLDNLIRGWQIALTRVKVGSKIKLIIPSELGYGAQDRPNIPANSTLVFDIDLVSTY